MRKLFAILTMLAALMLASVTAFAAPSLVDNAKILTPQQRQAVLAELHKQEQAHNVRIAVVTMKTIGGAVPGEYANKLLDDVYNDGAKGNMVLLQVTNTRKWYIATDKQLKQVIVGNEATEYMSKPMVAEFKKDNYAQGYITYAQKAGELLEYYEKEGEPWDPNAGINWFALVIAVGIGGAAAYGCRALLISGMSNVQKAVKANAYLVKKSFELTHSNDTYLYTNVSTVPKSKSSGGRSRDDGSVSESSADSDHGGGGGSY